MSFIRPEVVAAAHRWREALIGGGAVAIGLWGGVAAGGVLGWLSWALALIGCAVAATGVQRGRFRVAGDGPGVVDVTEGRIAYFGPLTGGAVDLAALEEVALDRSGRPAHWQLTVPGEAPLFVPVTAAGADALLDAFAQLPRFPTERALRALNAAGGGATIIWRRAGAREPTRLPRAH